MTSNLERFKNELDLLAQKGDLLSMAMLVDCHGPDQLIEALSEKIKDPEAFVKKLPEFGSSYQSWYIQKRRLS